MMEELGLRREMEGVMAMRAVKFTSDELAVVNTALAIWEATPAGGDLSETDKAELLSACLSARAKIAAAQGLPPPPRASEEG